MRLVQKLSKIIIAVIITLLGFTQCKTQNVETEVPFEISEKTYFYYTGGKEGTHGTNIKIVGNAKTRNITFTAIFFQNHEYKITPEFKGEDFILVGSNTVIKKKELDMYQDPVGEYGNEAPKFEKKIPFDLEKNEAVLVYRINGKDSFYKIKDIKQLDTVYYP